MLVGRILYGSICVEYERTEGRGLVSEHQCEGGRKYRENLLRNGKCSVTSGGQLTGGVARIKHSVEEDSLFIHPLSPQHSPPRGGLQSN